MYILIGLSVCTFVCLSARGCVFFYVLFRRRVLRSGLAVASQRAALLFFVLFFVFCRSCLPTCGDFSMDAFMESTWDPWSLAETSSILDKELKRVTESQGRWAGWDDADGDPCCACKRSVLTVSRT